MLQWMALNAANIVIVAVLAAVVAAILVHRVRGGKKGKTSCGCGCQGCPMSGMCHEKAAPKEGPQG